MDKNNRKLEGEPYKTFKAAGEAAEKELERLRGKLNPEAQAALENLAAAAKRLLPFY